MATRPGTTAPGSIHRAPTDRQILAQPWTIAPWIDALRLDWRETPAMRADFAAMGERLQHLHVKAFGRKHP